MEWKVGVGCEIMVSEHAGNAGRFVEIISGPFMRNGFTHWAVRDVNEQPFNGYRPDARSHEPVDVRERALRAVLWIEQWKLRQL